MGSPNNRNGQNFYTEGHLGGECPTDGAASLPFASLLGLDPSIRASRRGLPLTLKILQSIVSCPKSEGDPLCSPEGLFGFIGESEGGCAKRRY